MDEDRFVSTDLTTLTKSFDKVRYNIYSDRACCVNNDIN